MREILFRGKRTDNGEWVYGYYTNARYYLDKKEMHIIFEQDVEVYPHSEFAGGEEVIPETVGQYTGLTDKNGRKIFEGDIIRWHDNPELSVAGQTTEICFGKYNDADCSFNDVYSLGFYIKFSDGNFASICQLDDFKDDFDIIGNIYDNPELMKGGIENG